MKKSKKIHFIKLDSGFFIGLALSIFGTVASLFIPLLIGKAIDLRSILSQRNNTMGIIAIFVLLILSAVFTSLSDYLISRSGAQQIANIRLRVQDHLLYLPTNFFDDQLSGKLSSRVINDASIIQNFTTSVIPSSITGIITVVGTFAILFTLDWKLTLFIFLAFPLDALITIPIGIIDEKVSIKAQEKLAQMNEISSESLRNIRAVKLNNAENNVKSTFKDSVRTLYHLSLKMNAIFAVTGPIQTMFALLLIIVIILYGGSRVSAGTLQIGTLVAFLMYLFQIIGPINVLADFYASYKQAKGATKQITSILKTKPEVDESTQEIQNVPTHPTIKMEDVSFSYGDQDILDDISMSFTPNAKIAIVGPSGAGKTTIINLLTRLYPVQSGELTLNNLDAYDFPISQWRELFGVVTQDNTIFSGTFYDNLVLGLPKSPTQEDIEESIKIANLDECVQNLPAGIQTVIGEQGLKLSGGQRQRLQIARAYLKHPEFLILDEATSSLDSDSEQMVTSAIDKMMDGKTIIAIAHRLATIVDADKIYFLDDHHIMGCGNHEELMKQVPEYRRFVEEQFIEKD